MSVAIQNGSHSGRQALASVDLRPRYAIVRAVRKSDVTNVMAECSADAV